MNILNILTQKYMIMHFKMIYLPLSRRIKEVKENRVFAFQSLWKTYRLNLMVHIWAWSKINSGIHSTIFLSSRQNGYTYHSLIISRGVLILTLSIFNALKVCISWYSLATGLKSEATTYKDHVIRYSPCALGSVQRNTSLGTVFPRTLPRESIGNTSSRGNIGNAPAMM